MAVPEQIPYVGYIGNGTTTIFPITFHLSDPEYLVVTVNKEIPQTGNYTVDSTNGNVIFGVAPASGAQVELYRETQLNRDTEYKSYNNSFRPEIVNYDFDKVWQVLQEQHMIDAEVLARIKAEIEWRRTHDANFDELSKMRDSQIFSGLKQYLDTILAASNPNIFDGIGAGIVFANDQKSVQTHLDEIWKELKDNRQLIESKADISYVNQKLNLKANLSDVYPKSQTYSKSETFNRSQIEEKVGTVAGGKYGFNTVAEFEAVKNTIPANSTVTIAEAGANQGDNIWDGVTLSKSPYDPLYQAKEFTRARIDIKPINDYEFAIQDPLGNLALGIKKDGASEIPKLLAGDSLTEKKNIGVYAVAWVDKNGNVALGINKDGAVVIPKLVNGGSSSTNSVIKKISVADSDTIMHIGDSMTASHYCVQDKSHVSQLSQMSPFRHVNYGLSDDTLLRMQNRIINDVQTLGSSLKSAKPKYLFIHSYANDRPFANADIKYYQENMRRLLDTALAYGVQPVIVGYFLLNSVLHQSVKAVADEYQISVVWSDVLNKQIGFYDGATLFHEWHVGTRTNCLFWLPSLEYIKQQKPMRTLKIFRKRSTFTPTADYQLLFTGNVDKSKKWKEIGIGHYSLTHEYKYDELDSLPAEDRVWTYREDEYLQLVKKVAIPFSDYGLIEIGFDAYTQNMNFVEINLAVTGSPLFFVRDNLNQTTAMPPNISPTDQFYIDNFANPRGNWLPVTLAEGKILIQKNMLNNAIVGNKLYLMIKGSFTLSDISVNYSANKYESHLPTLNKPREKLGAELLAQPLLGNSSQLNGWVTGGSVSTLVPIDLPKSPRKPNQNIPVDGVVTLSSSNYVQQSISFASSEEVRTFKVVAWARYFPKAFLDRTNPLYSGYDASQVVDRSVEGAVAPINKDTFDIQEISLETWTGSSHPANNGAFQKDFVALIWRPVTFYVEVQPYETDLSIRLSAASGQVQLAKCSVKEVI